MMKAIRRAFLALVALGLIIAVAGAARAQGWHAVLRAFVDALPILPPGSVCRAEVIMG